MLQFERVSKRYENVTALDAASFTAQRGRILGFLGPNGAGKTTAMRCVFGLARPDSGTIHWDGQLVTQSMRLRFGYMPEERGLYPKMKVHEQLVHFARLSGHANPGQAATEWLDRLGLADRADSKVEELSHGNQQRVQLAVALAHEPEFVALDEPFSGLDPLGAESLTEILREISSGGAAILFSSHQLDLVEDVCEDVAIISDGQVVLSGDLQELRDAATTRRLDITVDGMPWSPADEGANRPIGPDADLGALLSQASAAGRVDRFSFEPPRLSDLFREAVGG